MAASSAPPKDDPFADRRLYPRATTALPAFLLVNAVRHSVQIVDVSSGGAKLDCLPQIAIGTAVTLDCGTFGRTAVVRWQSGGFLGLRFDTELDARTTAALIERSKALEGWMKARA